MLKISSLSAFDFLEPKRCLSGLVAAANPASAYPPDDAAYQVADPDTTPDPYDDDDLALAVIYDTGADGSDPDDPADPGPDDPSGPGPAEPDPPGFDGDNPPTVPLPPAPIGPAGPAY